MNQKLRTLFTILGVIITIFLMWYFSTITGYVIGAVVLTMVVNPLMDFFISRKIKNFAFPRWLAAILTLLTVLIVFVGIVSAVVPLISKEAQMISQINTEEVAGYFTAIMNDTQNFLIRHGALEETRELGTEIMNKVKSVMSIQVIGNAFTGLFSFISSFFMAVFSIFFITFFLLKDRNRFLNIFLSIFKKDKQYKVRNVLHKTRVLLSRYFIGLLTQLTIMITLESIGLRILNIPNAFLIGFIGGFMNIIPYLGPIMGGVIGVVLAVISSLALGMYDGLIWVVVKVILVFVGTNIIDNVFNQPIIFSKSVNAHPIEIFLVVIAAGHFGGIGAMIIAIPAYTVMRIILKEYFSEFAFINNITKNI
ncbi:MAG: AI-2E family transporter [Bacteroidales bacterium]|jgi:predicted PurR-regulated permease PerM|nr:AI-2E family transporter [Bacteroidales bacterium]